MSYKVKLEVFEGPLDLLLYLIKKEEIDIYDIPITKITEQYLEYLGLMEVLDLNIAGEFLVMAATLMHIKSKLLLPPEEVVQEEEAEEVDPRMELAQKLLEYKKFKEVAGQLREMEDKRSKLFTRRVTERVKTDSEGKAYFESDIFSLISAMSSVLKNFSREELYEIVKDEFTVEEKVHELIHMLVIKPVIYFVELFEKAKNKLEIITTFLALLELIRLKEVIIRQQEAFGKIEIIRNRENIKPILKSS